MTPESWKSDTHDIPDAVDATADLRRAAARATLARSVQNTQPWRFDLGPTSLDLSADATRRLPVIDPDGRQLTISCGAALYGARLSLQARGVPVSVSLLPDPTRPEHLAHVEILSASHGRDPVATAEDRAADERHTTGVRSALSRSRRTCCSGSPPRRTRREPPSTRSAPGWTVPSSRP